MLHGLRRPASIASIDVRVVSPQAYPYIG
jgi:hypothetical protein